MKAVAALIVLAAASLTAIAQPKDPEEGKILALENAWNLAEQRKDIKALDQLLGNGLVYIDFDGSIMNKAQFLESVQKPSLHPEQIANESQTVYLYGTMAIVTGVYHEKGIDKGKAYLRRGRFTDTWVFQKGMWQCVASQSTLMR